MEHREIKTPEQIAELKKKSPGGYRNLREEVINYLPTPQTGDGLKGMTSTPEHRIATGHQVMLSNHAPQLTNTWGRFERAIRRWESVLGRPAPAPTKPDGKDGNHRLSSKFTEWMMGLPEGWITDAGLTRNEELKACGNGVVPQQAELALRMLLK
jgi:DNA (cytosine-5)-methyltransferase 1